MDRGALGKTIKSTAAALAVGLFFSAGAVAQSSSGAIIGEAKIGDTITIYGTDNGFKRELKIDEDGKFQVRRVPTGYYDVSIKHADGTEEPSKSVVVKPGGAARVQ
ncbi:carboxypeptidase regulatory-like domain-containing protein [Luteimonas gilva]|uniref:Carboxypeptidase regulatory-like domain-containing protein n=1 Tax=Luteimonas gilva TaxID=2572684 RepID=A0A4U5JV13_9GAMM|nr:carboxypeptidase-like regulatory domain-containing protein [Luteimonas gilva]TKR33760.1 carboxypeptidase regulatory-like domain-containing protein [Luteimonas gilva]